MAWMIWGTNLERYSLGASPEFAETPAPDSYKFVDSLFDGRRLAADAPRPHTMATGRGVKRIPSLMKYHHTFVGRQPFVDLVESFEPGVHEWLPVRIRNFKTGEHHPDTWYILNICSLLRSVVLDDSVSVRTLPDGSVRWSQKSRHRVKVYREIAQTHHLWRDAGFPMWIFASDAFKAALENLVPRDKGWSVNASPMYNDMPLEEV